MLNLFWVILLAITIYANYNASEKVSVGLTILLIVILITMLKKLFKENKKDKN